MSEEPAAERAPSVEAAEPEPQEVAEPEPQAAAEPEPKAAEPVNEPTPEPAQEPPQEPTPEPPKEPTPEPPAEEEVAAQDLYKTAAHHEAPKGSPFDPDAPKCHPSRNEGDCKILDVFLASSTLWICFAAVSPKKDHLEFVAMGDDIKSLKASFDGKKQMFYLCKCKGRDVKNNVVSERVRVIRMTQLGSAVPIMKRRFKTDSWNLFDAATQGTSKDFQFDESETCDWLSWMKELRKIGGAHQPNQFMFGPDEVWNP